MAADVAAEAVAYATHNAAMGNETFDAIVVGGGATGGLAAELLTEKGLRVLLLDAGVARPKFSSLARKFILRVGHRLFGHTAKDVLERLLVTTAGRNMLVARQPIQSLCYAWPLAPEQFVDDVDCPYVQELGSEVVWLRCRQLGGRMVVPGHGRQYYRISEMDVGSEGGRPGWPFPIRELDRWYELVETRLGIAGGVCDASWFAASRLCRELSPTRLEAEVSERIRVRWPDAQPMLGCSAAPRNSIGYAATTGRLVIRREAVAYSIEVDNTGHVRGVHWVDATSGRDAHSEARIVFLCASALETTRILLLSRSSRHLDGLNASGLLGCGLMDHTRVRANGVCASMDTSWESDAGRCIYLPRFDARRQTGPASSRGYGVQLYIGQGSKGALSVAAACFGEMLPRVRNRCSIDPSVRDRWGVPVLRIDARHDADDLCLVESQIEALHELGDAIGTEHFMVAPVPAPIGSANHECGTARMGATPTSGVLSPDNECWAARGLYVTDGACLPSQGTQNPTLTLLALTARACDRAVRYH